MSSVLLDFDRSIQNGSLFWSSLKDAGKSKAVIAETVYEESGVIFPFAYYYDHKLKPSNREEIYRIMKRLSVGSTTSRVYDGNLMGALSNLGIELPSGKPPFTKRIDTAVIARSLDLIKVVLPAAYHEIVRYVCGFIVIESKDTRSMTSPDWFGCVFLGHTLFDRNDPVEISTSIIHEVGHLALFASASIESPLTDLTTESFSAFKQTERPAYMVLHAQMALGRMIMWLSALKPYFKIQPGKGHQSGSIDRFLEEFSDRFLQGMDFIQRLSYTKNGLQFLEDFKKIEKILKA